MSKWYFAKIVTPYKALKIKILLVQVNWSLQCQSITLVNKKLLWFSGFTDNFFIMNY